VSLSTVHRAIEFPKMGISLATVGDKRAASAASLFRRCEEDEEVEEEGERLGAGSRWRLN